MSITTADIKKLRERTGAGILDCKKALNEVDGDMEKAIEYLREKGIASAEKRSDKTASEGLVAVKETANKAAIVEINCETDFVAKNDNFQDLVEKMVDHVLAEEPADIEQALELEIAGEGKSTEEFLKEKIAGIGEKISFRRFTLKTKADDEIFGTYLHMGGKIGVLLKLKDATSELAKNIAMHVAAVNPEYLDRDSVPSEDVAKEKEVLKNQALEENKPEHIVEKIVEGRINKFFQQNCLLEQEYVRDTDLTIAQLLAEKDSELVEFVRYEVGEGIEVEEEDFVAEVQNEINS